MRTDISTRDKPFRVYIAGKMGGRPGIDVMEERAFAKSELRAAGVEYVDPADNENIERTIKLVDMSMDYVTMKNFVTKDLQAISHCDGLLVITGDLPSDGTNWEMGYAKFGCHIPVIAVAPRRCQGRLMGFTNILADALFPDIERAVAYIKENLARNTKYAIHR